MKISSLKKVFKNGPTKMVIGGVLLLVVGTFVAWRISVILSPQQSQQGTNATVSLQSSDHYYVGSVMTPLPNTEANDGITPNYQDTIAGVGATPLKISGTTVVMPRFQGTVSIQ